MRRIVTIILIALAAVATSCTPAEIAAFNDMGPEDQAKVVQALQDRQDQERRFYEGVAAAQADSGNCYVEMREVFPPHAWARMTAIINRESGGDPRAQNPSSSAAGCTQTLALHAPRYRKLGYSWEHGRYSASANIRVAHDLWLEAGWSPWNL